MPLKKVFGIISYFPDCDTDYHIETRRERSRRFLELLHNLEKLWPDVDILIIAQNWGEFNIPPLKNTTTVLHYPKLGILGARKELRKQFLASEYDYLIMLDDDGMIEAKDPSLYMKEIDAHPTGVGVIRHHNCPLMLLAISKDLYLQVDMPDLDPEKGEGFEDDLFVATCFNQFPEYAFDFSPDIIKETSFKYHGPGMCPSSWARETERDWRKMTENTAHRIHAIENRGKWMDFVVPYVNCADEAWKQSYIKNTTDKRSANSVRFRSWGTLKYLFRSVDKYMPFVRQIVLIVAGPSQVPVWVNRENVRVVYHSEFIPKQFLPTFNSCTIESFLYNIKGLSEKFIYANDDLFALNYCTEDMFFFGDIPRISFVTHEKYKPSMIFRCQCRAGMELIQKALSIPTDYPEGEIIRPHHITMPMTVKTLNAVKELCQPEIEKTISNIRKEYNVNQYIYPYYDYFTNQYQDIGVECKYFELNDITFNNIREVIVKGRYPWVCINDSSRIQNYPQTRALLIDAFKRRFPNTCRYEL